MDKQLEPQLYKQSGGVVSLIATIGMYIMQVVINVCYGLFNMLTVVGRLYPKDGTDSMFDLQNGWNVGLIWKFIWFSIKSSFFLLIFCIGGPVVIIIGIIYLYKNIFEKFGERNKYEEEILAEKQAQSGETQNNEEN